MQPPLSRAELKAVMGIRIFISRFWASCAPICWPQLWKFSNLESCSSIMPPRVNGMSYSVPWRSSRDVDTRWVLGLRGIIGDDKDVWSDAAIQCFKNYYDLILWYGDTQAMGSEYPNTIAQRFGVKPVETGYVSRLMESKHLIAL